MRMDTGRILATLRDRDLVPDQCQAAFLVGSTARGWSNKKSDLDICVVSAEPWSFPDSVEVAVSLEPDVVHWHTFHADNRDWDLAYWVDAQVDQMLTKISWAEYDQVRATSNDVLPPREESFLGRIATCVPLIGEDWVARRRAELDASAFRSVLVTRSLGAADRAIEDGLGQLADGDLHSAVISARLAYGHTVDALLEERGEYGSYHFKWRPRRFQAAQPEALTFDEYWAVETMRDFDPDDPKKWINKVLTACQDLALKVKV
ncbi:nucleotidyltransferase domain-containing protein [Streptomyces sp. NBC_01435]|uniref:nucleotidyltransferase domain-containing protein n=1 Tax=Streptomyces sp. NBC_01435 TaxID=2903865 RepID=UPI002E32EF10|nr:nucleotidyltransferase domain-containing protein [Streptomyces sp. NBC_01435]